MLHGRYRVARVLGKGGMGAVYLVEDLTLYGKYWAAKELLEYFPDTSERAAAIAQFQREVQILVNLHYPNCCRFGKRSISLGSLDTLEQSASGRG